MRKILIISALIILFSGIAIRAIYNVHPIILKYLVGEARNLGKPISARVYADGRINNSIQVYLDPKNKNDFLLHLKEHDNHGMLEYIDINLNYKFVGRTICSAKDCYDTINGRLFQDDTGDHFVDFKNDIKGVNFDPQLIFSNYEIKLNMPTRWLKFDSVRIELDHK